MTHMADKNIKYTTNPEHPLRLPSLLVHLNWRIIQTRSKDVEGTPHLIHASVTRTLE